ncbi:Hypothetical predicted protein [Paramuricea clavata]|uniref:Uncharacterized protein n=1 Tax=Paramuricea clavata TaxID=317549 RepID=A0A7D9L6W2_PARCT|nr:Hypothetical predicted protein [Paramuricea clavata]
MAAKTITEAKRLAKSFGNSLNHATSCNEGILVGGLNSNGVLLTKEDQQLILTCMQASGHVEESTKISIIYITSNNVEEVARVEAFLSVLLSGSYCTLAKIKLYQKLDDEDMLGELRNGDKIVEISNEIAVITATCIYRKVMLYPRPADDMDTIAVVDFERPNLPINFADITVPFYPMVNDIVVIRGENDEIWVAKILKVYTEEKTVKVWYYREQGHELFVPEVSSRDALDIVNWDSIVHLAPEEWIDGGS